MKRQIWKLFFVLIGLMLLGCQNENQTIVYNVSGKIFVNLFTMTPSPDVDINIYEVDSIALRNGIPVYSTKTSIDGSWGPFVAKADEYYEIELSKVGYTPVYHLYVPLVDHQITDANFEYLPTFDETTISGGSIVIAMENITKNILSTDLVNIDLSTNLNSTVSSNGTYPVLRIWDRGSSGNSLGDINYHISALTIPGEYHLIKFNNIERNVRVIFCSLNNTTIAIFK